MKTSYLFAALGLGLMLGAPVSGSAQTIKQQTQKKQTTMSIKAQMDRRAQRLLSGQSSGAYNDDALGPHFTDSSLLSVTRAGNFGNETGTMDSDVNGQIGTTDQNDMVDGPVNTGIFTSHFGPTAGNRPKTTRAEMKKDQTTGAQNTKGKAMKVNPSSQTKTNNQTNP